MEIEINPRKSIQQNAADYYEKGKKIKKKIKGLEKAIEETKKEIEKAKKEETKKIEEKIEKKRKEKKWYENFHWFFTSEGRLCIGGKDSSQNDIIFKKYMEENDLFFHADIIGGSVVILKDGIDSKEEEREACAQFAASFSRAWKMSYATIDVYSLKKDQLSKHVDGAYVGKGGIAMKGKREWFRSTPLKLRIGIGENGLEIIPDQSKRKLEKEKALIPGNEKKEKIAKFLSKLLKIHVDEIVGILPSGKCSIKEI